MVVLIVVADRRVAASCPPPPPPPPPPVQDGELDEDEANLAPDDFRAEDDGDEAQMDVDSETPNRASAAPHVRGRRKLPKEKDLPLGTHLKIDADDSLEPGPEASGGMALARLGRVVRVDNHPFDPERFQRLEENREDIGVLNVIRWRFDPETNEHVSGGGGGGKPKCGELSCFYFILFHFISSCFAYDANRPGV